MTKRSSWRQLRHIPVNAGSTTKMEIYCKAKILRIKIFLSSSISNQRKFDRRFYDVILAVLRQSCADERIGQDKEEATAKD